MKRVKIFMDPGDYSLLEKMVNQFLESLMPEKVLDIQYRDCDNAASVLIVYETEPAIAANDDDTSKWPTISWPSNVPTVSPFELSIVD